MTTCSIPSFETSSNHLICIVKRRHSDECHALKPKECKKAGLITLQTIPVIDNHWDLVPFSAGTGVSGSFLAGN